MQGMLVADRPWRRLQGIGEGIGRPLVDAFAADFSRYGT